MHKTRKIGIGLIVIMTLLIPFIVKGQKILLDHNVLTILIFATSISIFVGISLIWINSPKRAKAKWIILGTALFTLFTGIAFKYLNISGAGPLMVLGIFTYCFSFAPLQLKDKYLKWKPFQILISKQLY